MSLMSTIGKTGLVALVAVISSMTITAGGALAQDKMVEDSHRGIGLIAVPPKPGVKLDITIVGPRDGLDRVREALDLIYRESPYSRAQIETLNSPLKKASLTGFHATAKHIAAKAVSPSSETMRTI